tara:strand:+ start:107 stop:748 length:642 start_codon:yes stop_codon:yes gene_type:complete
MIFVFFFALRVVELVKTWGGVCTFDISSATEFSMASPPTAPNVVSFEQMPEGAKVQLEFDTSYANFKVERKADEIGDANFPSNLHNVAELFGQLHMLKNVTNLHRCVERFKTILKEGPDGKQNNRMGQAAIVCFNCGCVALPKGGDVGMECANCGEKEQTNKVVCKREDGSMVPWIENGVKPMTEEERRKKIEADVAMARKLQSLDEGGNKNG